MLVKTTSPEQAVLFALDKELARELSDALVAIGIQARRVWGSAAACVRTATEVGAAVIFCPSSGEEFMALRRQIRSDAPHVPMIVVSRHPEVAEWLDAIEAGAADYCAAPFEKAAMRWIVDCTLARSAA